jgi:signal transduction histidine kinase
MTTPQPSSANGVAAAAHPTEPLEVQLAQLQTELAAAQAEMQNFAATVSHDLRAPLRHITAFAKLLQEEAAEQLTGDAAHYLTHMTHAAAQLGTMLDGLLAYSRVGVAPLQVQNLALPPLLTALVQDQAACSAAVNVRWNLPASLPTVQADASLLTIALQQVLGNAIKFTQQRSEAAQIDISARYDLANEQVHCTIQDNGAGFATDQAARLFQPFIRLHSSAQFAGLGMGLALSRKSLIRMGGSISINAAPNVGCSVTLKLPASRGGVG